VNIFVTSNNPVEAASNLDDKRVVKMVLECAQMLSTAMHEMGAPDPPYRRAYVNHPCTIWTRQTRENYYWLLEHMSALSTEYSQRYLGKIHKCSQLIPVFDKAADYIPAGQLLPFANCTIYKGSKDIVRAYRDYLVHKWDHDIRKPTWYGCDKRPF